MGFMLAAAAITAGAGLASSAMASNSQDKAAKQQQHAMDQQSQTAANQLDFNKTQYADWQQNFDPSIKNLGALVNKEVRPDYSQIAADVGNSYDTSQGINSRNMERMGVKPTDGAFQDSQTQYGLGRALATVGADQSARQWADQQHYSRLAGFAGMGMGQQAGLTAAMGNSAGNLQNAYGNQANLYGQRAAQYNQSAAAGAGMLGRGLNGFTDYFSNNGGGGSGLTVDTSGLGTVNLPSSSWNVQPPTGG